MQGDENTKSKAAVPTPNPPAKPNVLPKMAAAENGEALEHADRQPERRADAQQGCAPEGVIGDGEGHHHEEVLRPFAQRIKLTDHLAQQGAGGQPQREPGNSLVADRVVANRRCGRRRANRASPVAAKRAACCSPESGSRTASRRSRRSSPAGTGAINPRMRSKATAITPRVRDPGPTCFTTYAP